AKRRNNAVPIGERGPGNVTCFVAVGGRRKPGTGRGTTLGGSGLSLESGRAAAFHRAAARRAKARCARDFTFAGRAIHDCSGVYHCPLPSSGSVERLPRETRFRIVEEAGRCT